MESSKPILYSFYRSSASYRVRIALALKCVDYEYRAVNLHKAEQKSDDYRKVNPKGEVPCFYIDGHYLTQSIAIIEYLEETQLCGINLLPKDPIKRAEARAIAEIVNSGMQPYQNALKNVPEEKKQEWIECYLLKGYAVLEDTLERTAGKYCVGDEITIADLCLVPQVYKAPRFNVSLENFPIIRRVNAELEKLPAFQAAHPSKQPDCTAH